MSDRRIRMLEDKYMRDSARALVEADIEHLKSDFAHKGLGERAIERVREGAFGRVVEAHDKSAQNTPVAIKQIKKVKTVLQSRAEACCCLAQA